MTDEERQSIRAAALEEAARYLCSGCCEGVPFRSPNETEHFFQTTTDHVDGSPRGLVNPCHAQGIRALAPLPPGFVVVPVADTVNESGDSWKAEALELRKYVAELGLSRLRNGPGEHVVVPVATLEMVVAHLRRCDAPPRADLDEFTNEHRAALAALEALR